MKVFQLLEAKQALTQSELEVLGLLIHDKKHIMSRGHRDHDLDSAIFKLKQKSTMLLYRGVSDSELKEIREGKADYYLSFSEDHAVAKRFGSNVITLKPGAVGLNYWKWGIESNTALVKQHGKEWAEQQDIEFILDSYRDEKEWVFPFATQLKEVEPLIFKQTSKMTAPAKPSGDFKVGEKVWYKYTTRDIAPARITSVTTNFVEINFRGINDDGSMEDIDMTVSKTSAKLSRNKEDLK